MPYTLYTAAQMACRLLVLDSQMGIDGFVTWNARKRSLHNCRAASTTLAAELDPIFSPGQKTSRAVSPFHWHIAGTSRHLPSRSTLWLNLYQFMLKAE